jgi:cytochrome c biogenesis protein CcdA
MTGLILFTLSMGLLDCLNPSTIATQLILLIRTKTAKTSAWFIISTFITYCSGGFLIYFGLAAIIKKFFSQINFQRTATITIAELIIGILLVLAGLYYWKKSSGQERKKEGKQILNNALAIFSIGVVSTLSDLPTALPYFGFIAKMEQAQPEIFSLIILFIIYNLIYILPLLIIHFLFVRNKETILQYAEKINLMINKVSRWLLLFILACGGIYLIYDAIVNL